MTGRSSATSSAAPPSGSPSSPPSGRCTAISPTSSAKTADGNRPSRLPPLGLRRLSDKIHPGDITVYRNHLRIKLITSRNGSQYTSPRSSHIRELIIPERVCLGRSPTARSIRQRYRYACQASAVGCNHSPRNTHICRGRVGLQLKGANVYNSDSSKTSLIGRQGQVAIATAVCDQDAVVAGVDSRTAGEQRVCQRRPAVVLERPE